MIEGDGNVYYLDEYRKEQWRVQLRRSRETGSVAIFGAMQPTDAVVLPFPDLIEDEGDDIA